MIILLFFFCFLSHNKEYVIPYYSKAYRSLFRCTIYIKKAKYLLKKKSLMHFIKKALKYEELHQMLLADIIEICRERNLPTEGTKSQLISDLLFWVKVCI